MNTYLRLTIQIKAIWLIVQFITLYKIYLAFESVDEILKCDYSH